MRFKIDRLNDDQVRAILLILHSTIFPNLVRGRVVRITDWLGSVCDRGECGQRGPFAGRFVMVDVLTPKSLFRPRRSSGFVVVEWIVHVDHAIQSVRDSLPMCQSSSCKLILLHR